MEKVKWLLVGTGVIAQKRVGPALKEATQGELIAVCDKNADAVEEFGNTFEIEKRYTDFETALAESGANAVYLATPVGLHCPMAIKAIQQGKHILIEKPLGVTGDDCNELLEVANTANVKAGCAYFRRCYPRYQALKTMVDENEFGTLVSTRLTYFSWFAPEKGSSSYWRVMKDKSGGGAMSDMGSHMFDLIVDLFGLPESIVAYCDNLVHDWDVEDTASVMMKFANGMHLTANIGWHSKTWRHEMEVVGTEAKISWLPYDTGAVVKTVGRDIEELDLPNAANVHQPLVDDFNSAILNNKEPVCPVSEAVKTNLLIDAIYRSSQEKREVKLS